MFGVILGLDIENFSGSDRSDELKDKRKRLERIVEDCFDRSLSRQKLKTIDTGDGCFILLDTGNYEPLVDLFAKVRIKANELGEIRFRGVLHVGKFSLDDCILQTDTEALGSTYVGNGINTATRYLNCLCLRKLLSINEHEFFAYGITREFFEKIYDEKYYEPDSFSLYGFQEKKFCSQIYLMTKAIPNLPSLDRIVEVDDKSLTPDFADFLIRADFVYQHKESQSTLETFFVYPSLRKENYETEDEKRMNSKEVIEDYIRNPRDAVIVGDEQSGRTSLCKVFFKALHGARNYFPIYLKLNENEHGKIQNKLDECLHQQYQAKQLSDLEDTVKVIIMDDFHLPTHSFQETSLQQLHLLKNTFVIVIVDDVYHGAIEKKRMIEDFAGFTIKEFGHAQRKELIEKWIDFNELPNDDYSTTDELCEYIDTTLLNGVIPYAPFYVLTVLAARSDFVPLNGEITSKAHCYQALVYVALRKSGIPDSQFGTFLNLLTSIAFDLFAAKINGMSVEQLESFVREYERRFYLPFGFDYLTDRLNSSVVFHKDSLGQYCFHTDYLFYYFVAKYLSEHAEEPYVFQHIESIYDNLERNANAYIGIFLIHHTKSIKVLDEILSSLSSLYADSEEASLQKDELEYLDTCAATLNKEVIEALDMSSDKRKETAEKETVQPPTRTRPQHGPRPRKPISHWPS